MKAAAVGPILLLGVDDNPLPCQQQGAKILDGVSRMLSLLSFYHPLGSFSLLRSVRLIEVTMTG